MKNNFCILFLLCVAVLCGPFVSVAKTGPKATLEASLKDYVKGKDANIGIGVIIEDKDTIQVNGDRYFPMLSVYKFPIAMALGKYIHDNNISVSDSIMLRPRDLMPDTYSPMRDKYIDYDTIRLPLQEIIAYSLQQSDNNASDILMNMMGGVSYVYSFLHEHGIENVNVVSTEAEMYKNNQLCYANATTPVAIANSFDAFYNNFDDSYADLLKRLLETCETGKNRLPKPLLDSDAIIGHKTGTGFTLQDGRLMAVNDAAFVQLPNGKSYSIAVFVENSGYTMAETEAIIAHISAIVYEFVKQYYD